MMRFILTLGLLAGLIVLFMSPVMSQTKIEFQAAQGYTDNLFLDNANTQDSYVTSKASITTYPFSFLEFILNNEYTYYSDSYNLSNFKGEAGFTLLPLRDESKFSLYINGNYSTQVYRIAYQHFSNDNYDFNISLGYSLTETLQLRAGWAYNDNEYTNELPPVYEYFFGDSVQTGYGMAADNDNNEIFIGGNATLPGSVAIDCEAGFATKNMNYVKRPDDRDDLRPVRDSLIEGDLDSYYFSPRISRPIGNKTGVSLTYTYRRFEDVDSVVVPGISTEFLSPWSSVYEGETITLTVKTFLIPGIIAVGGAGYWDKEFLVTEEKLDDDNPATPPSIIKARRDYMSRLFLSIQKPFRFHSGAVVEPALQLDYSDNNSSNSLYDYNNFSILMAVKVRL